MKSKQVFGPMQAWVPELLRTLTRLGDGEELRKQIRFNLSIQLDMRDSPRPEDFEKYLEDLACMVERAHKTLFRVRLVRLEIHGGETPEFVVEGKRIRAVPVNDIDIDCGPLCLGVVPSLPPCPDCGGDIIWAEDAYVSDARRCAGKPADTVATRPRVYEIGGGCGSLFRVRYDGR